MFWKDDPRPMLGARISVQAVARLAATTTALAGLLPCPLLAQAITPDRHATFSITSNILIDSNIKRLADSIPNTAGTDRVWSPAIVIDIERPIGRQDAYVAGTLGYSRYARNPALNTSTANIRMGVDLRAGARCTLRLGEEFVRQLASFGEGSVIGTGRILQTTQAQVARLNCERGYGLHPVFGYRHDAVRTSAPLLVSNDTVSDQFDVSLGVKRRSVGELALYANTRRATYPHALAGSPHAIRFVNAGLSFSRKVGSRLNGTASIGVNNVISEQVGVNSYSGLSWSTALNFTPKGRASFDLGMSRSSTQSTALGISYTVSTSAHARAALALTKMATLTFGIDETRQTFVNTPDAPPSSLGLGARTQAVSAGLHFAPAVRIGRGHLTFTLDWSETRLIARNSAVNAHNTGLTFGVRMTS